MTNEFPTPEQRARENREKAAIHEAQRTGKDFSYIDDGGCEGDRHPQRSLVL